MLLKDFDFNLPSELIAFTPAVTRSESRLLCVTTDGYLHKRFYDIVDLIEPNDLLVFNNTKVMPARLIGKKASGGKVDLLVERILDRHRMLAQLRVSKRPKLGDTLHFGNYLLEGIAHHAPFFELRLVNPVKSLWDILEEIGQIPLPPYIDRAPDVKDKNRYQTVYAKHKGSVAAPTAGLHFDEALLQSLLKKKVQFGYLTLHIGAGTFASVYTDDIHKHRMHSEYINVPEKLLQQIHRTKANKGRVIAVGTTCVRALESVFASENHEGYTGETAIFIYPGFSFRCVDIMITNFHLPKSTLFMLVCAFGGYETMQAAYQTAIDHRYLFYSYGDAMWLSPLSS